jgi:uncharacterized membrane protein
MARRDAVLRAQRDHLISQRRACVLIGVDPKTVRRDRPPDNPEVREEMHKIAEKRRRFGYRRVGIMLERQGMIMNEKKLYRIAATRTKAKRLDSRTVAALYARATDADWQAMTNEEKAFGHAALTAWPHSD